MELSRREATSALAAALERGEIAAAGTCYAEDAQLLTPTAGLIRGRKAIEEFWGAGLALGLSSVNFEPRCVVRLRDQRVEIGRYRVTVETQPTEARSECGTYVVLHRQGVNGTWQRAVDVLEPDEPRGSSPRPQGGNE